MTVKGETRIFRHTAAVGMEYCEVIGEDVPYRVCLVLCRKTVKCAMKWKKKRGKG